MAGPSPPATSLSWVASTRPTAEPGHARDQQEPAGGAAHLGGEQLGVEGPEREPRARRGDDRDHGCEPEQHRTVGQEERTLEHGGDQQPDDGHRSAAAALGQPAGEEHADDPGEPGGDRAEHGDVGVGEVVRVGEVAVREL